MMYRDENLRGMEMIIATSRGCGKSWVMDQIIEKLKTKENVEMGVTKQFYYGSLWTDCELLKAAKNNRETVKSIKKIEGLENKEYIIMCLDAEFSRLRMEQSVKRNDAMSPSQMFEAEKNYFLKRERHLVDVINIHLDTIEGLRKKNQELDNRNNVQVDVINDLQKSITETIEDETITETIEDLVEAEGSTIYNNCTFNHYYEVKGDE